MIPVDVVIGNCVEVLSEDCAKFEIVFNGSKLTWTVKIDGISPSQSGKHVASARKRKLQKLVLNSDCGIAVTATKDDGTFVARVTHGLTNVASVI